MLVSPLHELSWRPICYVLYRLPLLAQYMEVRCSLQRSPSAASAAAPQVASYGRLEMCDRHLRRDDRKHDLPGSRFSLEGANMTCGVLHTEME